MPRQIAAQALLALVALGTAACTSGAPVASPPGATPVPEATASSSPKAGAIDFAQGASDVVLRYEEGGGFVPVEWLVTQAPIFTLYGDGTVLVRDPANQAPADETGLLRLAPFTMLRLSDTQMQELLAYAINEGGLGVARESYEHNGVADAGTAIFTISAGGRTKEVSIYALGIDGPETPDALIRKQFLALAERLRTFADEPGVNQGEYQPKAWRATLLDTGGVPMKVAPWPWDDIAPSDFKTQGDEVAAGFPSRLLTAEEVAALGLGDLSGGLQGLFVEGPDGKPYGLSIRPLLPDEEA